MREQIHRLLTAFFAATLGGARRAASTRAVVPTGDNDSDHGSRSHDHKHAGRHEDHAVVGTHHGFANANAWTNVFDDPARDAWQRPDDVLRALELAPTMTVADVGAGTGYFTVRLARAVPAGEIIATDVEPDMVRYLNERARREQLNNVRAILAIQTTGGRLFVVDFSPTARRGPPENMRVAPELLVADLAAAGLVANLSPVALPDQSSSRRAWDDSSMAGVRFNGCEAPPKYTSC